MRHSHEALSQLTMSTVVRGGRQTQPCSLVPVPRGAGKNGAPTLANYLVSQGENQSW